MTRPVGALSEDQRRELVRRYGFRPSKVKNDRIYYSVDRAGHLDHGDNFCFIWSPETAYYFDNYWHAWAYSLTLRAKK